MATHQTLTPHDGRRDWWLRIKISKERITFLEDEVMMIKVASVNTPFENEDVQDDRQIVNFITKVEVGTFVGDVGHDTPPNDDAN
ncbi:hypothetical protein RYX36_009565, partial [Vicia faba]